MEAQRTPLGAALHIVDRLVYHIEEKSIAFSVIFLAVVLVGNVILRQFDSSIASTEELSQFAMFFITFLGASYAARSGMHIRMSMLSDALKGKPRKILAIIVSLGTAMVMFYVAYLSYRYVMKIVGEAALTRFLNLGGEDFSEFSQRVPAVFAMIGAGCEKSGAVWPHHHPKFRIDEDALAIGLEWLLRSALKYLS